MSDRPKLQRKRITEGLKRREGETDGNKEIQKFRGTYTERH